MYVDTGLGQLLRKATPNLPPAVDSYIGDLYFPFFSMSLTLNELAAAALVLINYFDCQMSG